MPSYRGFVKQDNKDITDHRFYVLVGSIFTMKYDLRLSAI